MVDLFRTAPDVFNENGSVRGLVTPNDTKLKKGTAVNT